MRPLLPWALPPSAKELKDLHESLRLFPFQGLAASYPLILFPSVYYTTTLSTSQLIKLWSKGYDTGVSAFIRFHICADPSRQKATIVPVPLIGCVLFSTATYLGRTLRTRRTFHLLVAASVLSLGHFAFTLAAIMPTVHKLKDLEKVPELSEAQEKEARGLIKKWEGLHLVRIASLLAATVTGVAIGSRAL